MEFRLIYEGQLPSGNVPNPKAKHEIRKQIHKQLAQFWKIHPFLKDGLEPFPDESKGGTTTAVEKLADAYNLFGYRFVPLIRKSQGATCSIDVLFLRRDGPGGIVDNRGDVDNRIKTLFDGLHLPQSNVGLGAPDADEDPFYCLLEDDRLITEVNVATDRLLRPIVNQINSHDTSQVLLVIAVKIKEHEAVNWSFHFNP